MEYGRPPTILYTLYPMSNKRINFEDALVLYRESSLIELAMRADAVAGRLHPEPIRTFVVERNINYTNVCRTRCWFCAFSVGRASKNGYQLSIDAISEKIEELVAIGGNQILLQGGLNPDIEFGWYEQMLSELKERWPEVHIHGFSPPEIMFFSQQFDMPVGEVLSKLRQAGLDTIPGGGAEILVDRVRKLISPAKCSADEWLEVMRQAHAMGICTTATMMFGHVETIAERIEHLERIRQLQDESLERRRKDGSAGFFTAFTCWPFQPGRTQLSKFEIYDPTAGQVRGDKQLLLAGACEQLKMTALARIYLDNIRNIQASWVTQGAAIGQLSLLMGCNDIGSLMMEENVVAAAGTVFKLKLSKLKELIRQAGYEPAQRDCYYRRIR